MDAAYVFRVEFRLDPEGATVDPERFETTMEIPAGKPSEKAADSEIEMTDWLFFRDRLWRGEIGDESSFRRLASDRLGAEVVAVDFRELRIDEASLDALKSAIATDLDRFNADSVDEVLHKYLGSSIHVRER